jgi:drug/metabolite transporter (DMT)-like permease
MSPRLRAYVYLILTSLIWGVAAVVIKLTLSGIEPLAFLTYRFLVSSIFALLWIAIAHQKYVALLFSNIKNLVLCLAYGALVSTIALGFLFLGLSKTTVLDLSLIDLLGPITVALLGVVFLKEHFTHRKKLGTAIAFTGAVLILIGPQFFEKREDGILIGNFFVFLYVLSDSISSVILKKMLREKFPPLFLVNFSFIVGFLTIAPVSLIKYSPNSLINLIARLPLQYHAGVWFMAIISGSLAFFLRALGQKTIEIGEAGIFTYLISVFSAPLAIIILGEKLTPNLILGTVIIVAGIIIAEHRKKMYN